jgi:ABC-type transport system involved in cytochrome c biogenesis permease subunit
LDRVTVICFLASYGVALGLELWHFLRPRPIFRLISLGFGLAGLVAHTIYLYQKQPPLVWQFGWLLFVAWILAIFYLSGSIHHARLAWGVFVLPLILGLLGLGLVFGQGPKPGQTSLPEGFLSVHTLWAPVHALLLILATVGVCVGFVASLMYLFQAHRLRAKTLPGKGLRLLSLERLEAMNRRAIVLAFPLLTAGMLAGAIMILRGSSPVTWTDPRVLSTGILWLAFVLLLYLRYGYHLRGRQLALLTIIAFTLLLCCVVLSHPLKERSPASGLP